MFFLYYVPTAELRSLSFSHSTNNRYRESRGKHVFVFLFLRHSFSYVPGGIYFLYARARRKGLFRVTLFIPTYRLSRKSRTPQTLKNTRVCLHRLFFYTHCASLNFEQICSHKYCSKPT